jgi:fatty-acid desaturase
MERGGSPEKKAMKHLKICNIPVPQTSHYMWLVNSLGKDVGSREKYQKSNRVVAFAAVRFLEFSTFLPSLLKL